MKLMSVVWGFLAGMLFFVIAVIGLPIKDLLLGQPIDWSSALGISALCGIVVWGFVSICSFVFLKIISPDAKIKDPTVRVEL